MIILINSSKTMQRATSIQKGSTPVFIEQATKLHAKVTRTSRPAIMRGMHISRQLADTVITNSSAWQPNGATQSLFAFQGDIYQGLQAHTFTESDIAYANERLRILSGLYGILRPLDLIEPYRLEVGYGFPRNLYTFWGNTIASQINAKVVINLASAEYAKVVLPFLSNIEVIEPQFLVQYPGEQPKFAAYHAKIARGAYAAWLIKTRWRMGQPFKDFAELNYAYNNELSSENRPVYILKTTKK
jgi:cytoplasmic iron level regulating protein YaaA (DUF328/UPF0246 family)